ncbi:hormonally up-regulated neu tumor-associated kinase-like [Haliotis rufescens]|uniref:hormonally up-regulated neu tumor-associated kinase-like n=1 Tax=Haliotis rufescens TaxID=6454 RepID=UPI00201F7397|nr:hormonally up-regulated neu tumor-associated kinase-like [Haliotis rufescens]XP_048240388.1 hormonally up-regulated neu tumor-associated kinase-like [Haliotis rufescens]
MADSQGAEEGSPGGERKKKVGQYVLGRKIGEGRYTTVRLGTHNIAHERVAVKVIPKKVLVQKEAARRHFRRQALLSQYVHHPNIIRLYEAMETPNSYYLVLEMADRGHFCQYLAQKRCLDENETRKFASQLVSAVDHMHVSGIVHRDLRLDNFLLDKDFNLKISDFGQGSHPVPGSPHPAQGMAPAYVAPEMFTGKQGGPAADIWSIGVCVFTMLSGRLPFMSDTPSSLQQIHANILQGCRIPASLSPGCKDFLSHLLEPFESKRIMMDDLLTHPWLTNDGHSTVPRHPQVLKVTPEAVDINVVRYLSQYFGFNESELLYSVSERKVDSASAAYLLMVKGVEEGFILPHMTARSDSTTSTQTTSTSGDSGALQDVVYRDHLPRVGASSEETVTWLASCRPVSLKTSFSLFRKSHASNTLTNRPKSFDPHMIPSVKTKKPFLTRNSQHKLPEISSTRSHSPDPQYGTYGRHRDAWKKSESDQLNVRGQSPVRNREIYVNIDRLMPQVFGFDPPAPPNTAYGMRKRLGRKADVVETDNGKARSGTLPSVCERGPGDPGGDVERQKSRILCSVDLTSQKRPLSYGQPLSSPKQLTAREQRNATIAVFRKISEQNAMNRALQWNKQLSERPPTSMSTESAEKDDFLNPVIKVTISTCDRQ